MFSDIPPENVKTRHCDYNIENIPAVKSYMENFPSKKLITNWNSLGLDFKATADENEFKLLLCENLFSRYSDETKCTDTKCYNCSS